MVKNSLENPFFLLFLLFFAVSVNFILSIHFIIIIFAGILSNAFYKTLKQKYYYSLFFVVLAFLLIELNLGLKPFSLSLLSYFIYLFLIPRYEQRETNIFLYTVFFYLGLALIWYIFFDLNLHLAYVLFMNLLLDFILIGILL